MIAFEGESNHKGFPDCMGKWTTEKGAKIAVLCVTNLGGTICRCKLLSRFGVALQITFELLKLKLQEALVAGSDPIKFRIGGVQVFSPVGYLSLQQSSHRRGAVKTFRSARLRIRLDEGRDEGVLSLELAAGSLWVRQPD